MHGAEMLGGLANELAPPGSTCRGESALLGARAVADEGVDARLGGINRFTSVAEAVEGFQ